MFVDDGLETPLRMADARVLYVFGTTSNPSAQEQLALLEAAVDDLRSRDVALVDVDKLPEVKLSHDRANVPLGEFAIVLQGTDRSEVWRSDVVVPVDEIFEVVDALSAADAT